MKSYIKPSRVKGTVIAPPSKSVAQRAIAIASMANGQSEILSAGSSDDVKAAISVCKALGANIDEQNNKLVISGGLSLPKETLNCGESGLGLRMFSCIAATLSGETILTGKGSLLNRPVDIIEDSLAGMGVSCKTNSGKLPIKVQGPLPGGVSRVDGSISSQVLTGLLIASPYAMKDTIIEVNNLQSKPYIDVTIGMMKYFGVEVDHNDYNEFRIKSGQKYQSKSYTIDGDWSGAAFMLVAGAIAGNVKIENLLVTSSQADKAIINALNYAGAKISLHYNHVEIVRNKLNGFDFDATDCPDLFPPLVSLASNCKGESKILGVSRLRTKESDRAATLVEEFSKMGIGIRIEGELMIIQGGSINSAKVSSHGDHRIAMATAIAALTGNGVVEIDNSECVAKSYPNFFDDLNKILC